MKKNFLIIFLGLLMIMLPIAGCGTPDKQELYSDPGESIEQNKVNVLPKQEKPSQEKTEEFETVSNDDFKVNIPKDWKETLLMQGIYNYVPEQAENDEVINIVVLEIDDTYVKDLKELLDVSIKATQEQVEDFILIKSNVDDTLDNNKAATLKFVQIIEGETTEINQIFAIANNKLYTITYSCPRQCDNFDVYTEMISSFKIN